MVARQDLDDGIGAAERSKSLPLSEEDRNLRMGELLSLGVDLPKDRLLILLRYAKEGRVRGIQHRPDDNICIYVGRCIVRASFLCVL